MVRRNRRIIILEEVRMSISIKKILINKPATIVYFDDGTKTVVKCSHNDTWDTEKGIAMAIAKRAMNNPQNFNEILYKMVRDAENPKKTNYNKNSTKKISKREEDEINGVIELLNSLFELFK